MPALASAIHPVIAVATAEAIYMSQLCAMSATLLSKADAPAGRMPATQLCAMPATLLSKADALAGQMPATQLCSMSATLVSKAGALAGQMPATQLFSMSATLLSRILGPVALANAAVSLLCYVWARVALWMMLRLQLDVRNSLAASLKKFPHAWHM